MSFAQIVTPVQFSLAALRPTFAALGVAVLVLRPLIGLGLVAAILWLFKPLLRGLARAAYMVVRPRVSSDFRNQRRTMRETLTLNRMARELDTQQPGVAAELRMLAARG